MTSSAYADDGSGLPDGIQGNSDELMQSAESRASSNVTPCVAGDQFDWGGENVLSTDGGVSVYAANNLYVGLPPASMQKTDGGNPILAGSLGYFVESEGVHVVGGNLSHSQGGWNSIGRVSWGSGHPATGTALAVGGNAGAVHSYFGRYCCFRGWLFAGEALNR